ncbi:acyltransferase family protein [Flexivirga oryzae]|uniref:Peptidoglycan/LPS O-acetylase OafA/YrhL n=1 Tax=Flexivirga oryzae TaxID=1794944 RepID=A0A839N6V5_9MICO|nr:acyltransferase [Flexivirga oryzae]MBB2891376.1 peptidoglycan/LPS O-acetylase OafA/YrhL [Flexivirga oryzae]
MARYRLIDGLRGLAALLVLLSHVGFWTGADHLDLSGGLLARGDSGVAVFFAISAFLLLRPWLPGAPPQRIGGYAGRRAARILPAYLIALAAVLLVAGTWGAVGGAGLGGIGKVVAHLLLVQGYADTSYQSFSQTWSLTTEVSFYVLVPVIGRALGRLLQRSPRAVYGALGATVAGGVVIQAVTAVWTQHSPTTHAGVLGTSVLGHAAWFAAGAALAIAVQRGDLDRLRDIGVGTWLAAAGVVYLIASSGIAGPRDLHAPTVGAAVAKELLYTLLAGLLLLAAVRGPSDERWCAVAASPATRFVGDLSYGVFLWHVLVLQVIYRVSGWALFTGGFSAVLFAVLVFSWLIAWASATLVEQPILRRVHRRTRTPRVPARQA